MLNDISIKWKILSGFFIILVFLIGVYTLAFLEIKQVARPLTTDIPKQIIVVREESRLDSLAQLIRYYDEVLTQSARNYAFSQDYKWSSRYSEAVPLLDGAIKSAIEAGGNLEKKFFSSVDQANMVLVDLEMQAITLVDEGKALEAIRILESEEYWRLKDIYEQGLRDYVNGRGKAYNDALSASTETLQSATQNATRQVIFVRNGIFVLGILSLIIIFTLGWIVAMWIARPIISISRVARDIGNGEVQKRLHLNSKDEIGQLAKSFNFMMDKLVAEEGLRAQIIDALPGGLFLLDTEGNIEQSNPALEVLLGYNGSELLGKPISIVFPPTPTPTPPTLSYIGLDDLLEKGVLHGKAINMRAQDGEEIPVMLYGRTIDDAQGNKRAVLVALDRRKEKKYVEERLAEFLPTLHNVAVGDFSKSIPEPSEDDEFSDFIIALNLIFQDIEEAVVYQKKMIEETDKRNRDLALKAMVLEDTKTALKETFNMLQADKDKLENTDKALKARMAESERMNKLMVGRELKMRELKEEIRRLSGNK